MKIFVVIFNNEYESAEIVAGAFPSLEAAKICAKGNKERDYYEIWAGIIGSTDFVVVESTL